MNENLGLHDEQLLETQVEGLASTGEGHKCIEKLESLIFQIFQNVFGWKFDRLSKSSRRRSTRLMASICDENRHKSNLNK